MPRHQREPGLLPRPLAILGALVLTAATGVAIRLLPAGAEPPPKPVTRPLPAPSQLLPPATPADRRQDPPAGRRHSTPSGTPEPPGFEGFVGFVDTAREPGFDLPVEFRRTGVRRYALGHLVAGGDGCAPKWTGALDPGENPVANRIGRLRALGGDAAPVFGGPGGEDLADTCLRPGGLAAAYRRVVGAFDAAAVDFEVRDGADSAAVQRRARAIRAVQRERRLRVSFTLRLRPDGLSPGDVAMLRATRQAGADVGTVNLLAAMEPRTALGPRTVTGRRTVTERRTASEPRTVTERRAASEPRTVTERRAASDGRLHRVAVAVLAARDQVAEAQGLADPERAWRRIALTPVLAAADDLSESDAHKLADYAASHGLAWLSLRGVAPAPRVLRVLRRGLP
ncbi:hypothetical protein ABGB18_09525 [Nonomuraea sp. B12E4]|uniref:hypothetical protein n=1 Tax=Nonomuraea sp. B12E4 TaxID=3153564 RepID=UPI00325C6974